MLKVVGKEANKCRKEMERAPRARAPNQEKARANAIPGTETVDPRARVAADKAGEQAKGPVAVRARAEEQDRDAVGNPEPAAAAGGYIMLGHKGVAYGPPRALSLSTVGFLPGMTLEFLPID